MPTHEFRQRCATVGLAVTVQRWAIYHALCADAAHPCAEELHQRLKPHLPNLALGTVYRTLEVLVQHGLITRVPTGAGTARFDADTSAHAHVRCVRCQRVSDWPTSALAAPTPPADFRLLGYQLHGYGVCAACADTPN